MPRFPEDNNIISFDDARRMSARGSSRMGMSSQDGSIGAFGRTPLRDASAASRDAGRNGGAAGGNPSRSGSFARGTSGSQGRVPSRGTRDASRFSRGGTGAPFGLDSSEELPAFSRDPFAHASKVSRSGRLTPLAPSRAFSADDLGEDDYPVTTRRASAARAGGASRAAGHGGSANSRSASAAEAPRVSRSSRSTSAGAPASRFAIDERDLAGLFDFGDSAGEEGRGLLGRNGQGGYGQGARADRDSRNRDRIRTGRDGGQGSYNRNGYEDGNAAPRAALEVFDESDLEDEDAPGTSKKSRKKKRAAKAKAEKMFFRQFGSGDAPASESGSRAALYKGEMGKSHKRAFTDLGGGRASSGASRADGRASSQGTAPRGSARTKLIAAGIALACLAAGVVFLYPPAQQFYIESRTQDRLQAEYDALKARNDSIQGSIDHLSTDEGIKDEAREQLGWVEAGEIAVGVQGLPEDPAKEKQEAVYAQVANGSVPTPETWYSRVLDPFFGYADPASVTATNAQQNTGSTQRGNAAGEGAAEGQGEGEGEG